MEEKLRRSSGRVEFASGRELPRRPITSRIIMDHHSVLLPLLYFLSVMFLHEIQLQYSLKDLDVSMIPN
jgi:hypothetical protein